MSLLIGRCQYDILRVALYKEWKKQEYLHLFDTTAPIFGKGELEDFFVVLDGYVVEGVGDEGREGGHWSWNVALPLRFH